MGDGSNSVLNGPQFYTYISAHMDHTDLNYVETYTVWTMKTGLKDGETVTNSCEFPLGMMSSALAHKTTTCQDDLTLLREPLFTRLYYKFIFQLE